MKTETSKPRASSAPTRESAVQIGNRYGVSRRKVIYWYHGGLIPAAIHVGRVLRFDPEEVEAALQKATK